MHAKHADRDRLNGLSGSVIGCAFTVLNTLGAGFLEKALELRASGLAVVQQFGVRVYYNDAVVGRYFADLLVEDVLLVELKTVKVSACICVEICLVLRHHNVRIVGRDRM
jgi:GxxExxY protein